MHIFPNDKKYIGIAKEDRIEKRWGSNGCGYFNNRQNAIENAIKKYGWENVRHIILETNLTKDESKQKEIEYIKRYNTNGKNGYNMTLGGDNHSFMAGKNNPSSRPVICNDIEYPTLKDFCRKYNLKMSIVSLWLNGKYGMPEKYYNMRLHFKNTGMEQIVVQHGHPTGKMNNKSRQIIFDNQKYDSLKEFCQKYKLHKDTVRGWMIGKYPMPRFFYDKRLRYADADMSMSKRSNRKNKFDSIYTESN